MAKRCCVIEDTRTHKYTPRREYHTLSREVRTLIRHVISLSLLAAPTCYHVTCPCGCTLLLPRAPHCRPPCAHGFGSFPEPPSATTLSTSAQGHPSSSDDLPGTFSEQPSSPPSPCPNPSSHLLTPGQLCSSSHLLSLPRQHF